MVELVGLSVEVVDVVSSQISHHIEYLSLLIPWYDLIVTLSTLVRLNPQPILHQLIHVWLPIVHRQIPTNPSPTLPLPLELCLLDSSITRQSKLFHGHSLLSHHESLL